MTYVFFINILVVGTEMFSSQFFNFLLLMNVLSRGVSFAEDNLFLKGRQIKNIVQETMERYHALKREERKLGVREKQRIWLTKDTIQSTPILLGGPKINE